MISRAKKYVAVLLAFVCVCMIFSPQTAYAAEDSSQHETVKVGFFAMDGPLFRVLPSVLLLRPECSAFRKLLYEAATLHNLLCILFMLQMFSMSQTMHHY